MICIVKSSEGIVEGVKTKNLDATNLYEEILNTVGNQDEALNVISYMDTDSFNEAVKTEGELPEAKTLLNFAFNDYASKTKPTADDIISITAFASAIKLTDVSTLDAALQTMFRPNGYLQPNVDAMLSSGIYSATEVDQLVTNPKELQRLYNVVAKVSGMARRAESLPINVIESATGLKDTTTTNEFGQHRTISDFELTQTVLKTTKGTRSREDFDAKIQGLPIPSIVEQYNNDATFADTFFEKHSIYTAVKTATITDNKLKGRPEGSVIDTLKATLMYEIDSSQLTSAVSTFLGTSVEVRSSEPKLVKDLIKQIEKEAVGVGIDIIGLHEKSHDAANTMIVATQALSDKLKHNALTPQDVTDFANIYQEVFNFESAVEENYELVPKNYQNKNIIKLYSEVAPQTLFEEFGLIKVGDNLYHRLNQKVETTDLYEKMFQRMVRGDYKLPIKTTEITAENKPEILEQIKSYINSLKKFSDIENIDTREKMTLLSVLSNHTLDKTVEERAKDVTELSKVTNDPNYLTSDFVSDFYQLFLQEKLKGSELYNQVLSNFEFNVRDITIKQFSPTFLNNYRAVSDTMPLSEKLEDYARLKKSDPIRSIIGQKKVAVVPSARGTFINNPGLLTEFKGEVKFDENYMIAESVDAFLKVNEVVYEQAGTNVYMRLDVGRDDNYYNTTYNEKPNQTTVNRLEKENPPTPLTPKYNSAESFMQGEDYILSNKDKMAFQALQAEGIEVNQIKAKAIREGNFMLAPNGAKSNLDEKQWLQVRTQNFKEWFGDWVSDPKNASKVVDENGEPQVMYHGTNEANYKSIFKEGFNNEFAGKNTKELDRNEWFWFSNNPALSGTYGMEKIPVFISSKDTQEGVDSVNSAYSHAYANKKDGLLVEDSSDSLRDTRNVVYGEESLYADPKGIGGFIADEVVGLMDSEMAVETIEDSIVYYTERELEVEEQEELDILLGLKSFIQKNGIDAVSVTKPVTGRVVAVPRSNQVKSIDNQGTYSALTPNISFQTEGFFSNAESAVANIKDKNPKNVKGWMNVLTDVQKNGGIKSVGQELEWIGLEDFLNSHAKVSKAKSIPHSVVEDYIKDNKIEVVEVNKTNTKRRNFVRGEGFAEDLNQVKYNDYQLKGGENYREVLLTLPSAQREGEDYTTSHFNEKNILAHVRLNEKTLPDGRKVLIVNEVQSDWAQDGRKEGFYSKKDSEKFEEYLADVTRLDELKTEIGAEYDKVGEDLELKAARKILVEANYFIGVGMVAEGVRSLYSEKPRRDSTPVDLKTIPTEVQKAFSAITEKSEKLETLKKESNAIKIKHGEIVHGFTGESSIKRTEEPSETPNMPYKKTDQWVGMAMRRVMQMAAQEGYDGVALATGEQSAALYDLSKKVDHIRASPGLLGGKMVYVSMMDNSDEAFGVDKEGIIVEGASAYKGQKLEDVLGKEMAGKILGIAEETVFKDEDLEVGGKGMKTFYDEIVPKILQKEASRFDKDFKKKRLELIDFDGGKKVGGKKVVEFESEEGIDGGIFHKLIINGEFVEGEYDFEIEAAGFGIHPEEEDLREFFERHLYDEMNDESTDKTRIGKQLMLPITPMLKEKLSGAVPLFQAQNIDPVLEAEAEESIVDAMNALLSKKGAIIKSESLDNTEASAKSSVGKGAIIERSGVKDVKVIELQDYADIPMFFSISDALSSGEEGAVENLKGGLLFNYTEGNTESAWAWVTEDKAKGAYNRAKTIYENNKPMFERLWKDGDLPNGQVPMGIVRMGEDAIKSNEALFRAFHRNFLEVSEDGKSRVFAELQAEVKEMEAGYATNATILAEIDALAKEKKANPTRKKSIDNKIKKLKKTLKSTPLSTTAIDYLNQQSSLEDVFNNITGLPLSHRGGILGRLTSGSASKVHEEFKSSKPAKDSSPLKKAIYSELDKVSDAESNTADAMNVARLIEGIYEPLLKNTPPRHIVALNGVDVLAANPVIESNHPNYDYALKGGAIGILSESHHLASVVPEMLVNTVKQIMNKGKDDGGIFNSSTEVGMGIPNKLFDTLRVDKGAFKDHQIVNSALRIAFPRVHVLDSAESWKEVIDHPAAKKMISKGNNILGATLNNNVYLNPTDATINTSIHEFGHVWLDFVESTNADLYNKGLKLVEGTAEFEKQKQKYPQDMAKAQNEALAVLIGNKGETIVNAAKKSEFVSWLEGMWSFIQDVFTGKKISDLKSKKAINKLTLGEFVDGAVFDLLAGDAVSKSFGKSENTLSEHVDLAVEDMVEWYTSPEGKGDPSISKRKEELRQAAENLKEGKITNEEFRAKVEEISPVTKITQFFEPATTSEIVKAVGKKIGENTEKLDVQLPEGSEVGLRLDIPSYLNNNTWVITLHEGHTLGGKAVSYTNVAKIKNVQFATLPSAALNIAAGKSKATIARMFGETVNIKGETLEDRGNTAKKEIEQVANDPSWVQVGMNPFRHSYFYDRSSVGSNFARPLVGAEEVLQVGGLVYAKNPQYTDWTSSEFTVKGKFDSEGQPVQFQTESKDENTRAIEVKEGFRNENGRPKTFLDNDMNFKKMLKTVQDFNQINKGYKARIVPLTGEKGDYRNYKGISVTVREIVLPSETKIENKLRETYKSLNNPINIVSLHTSEEINTKVNECR